MLKYVSAFGGSPPPHINNIGDISGKFKLISTKFSAICLLTRVMSINQKMLKYATPSWGTPHPLFYYICGISGNYQQIYTKLSVTNPMTRLMSIR